METIVFDLVSDLVFELVFELVFDLVSDLVSELVCDFEWSIPIWSHLTNNFLACPPFYSLFLFFLLFIVNQLNSTSTVVNFVH